MWTPRRILLFLLTSGVTLSVFWVYSHFLGWLDGLPPLPEIYIEVMEPNCPLPPIGRDTETNRRLRLAWGPNCVETDYTIKLDIRARGLLLAAGEFQIEADGRVQLSPLSLAVFGNSRTKDGLPDIHTLHCDRAYLEFDRPVRNLAEMSTRKIIAAELVSDPQLPVHDPRKGNVLIANNRRTLDVDDDIVLRTPGPVYYRETPIRPTDAKDPAPHIWTQASIEVVDRQNVPRDPLGEPIATLPTVTGEGLRIYLQIEPPAPPGTPPHLRKANEGSITGVERVNIDSAVLMNLWIDAQSRFLSGGTASPETTPATATAQAPNEAPAKPAEKVLVRIETNGPFQYDMNTDRVRFEIAPQADPNLPNHVIATRYVSPTARDMLACDWLEIEFLRNRGNNTPQKVSKNAQGAGAVAMGPSAAVAPQLKPSSNGKPAAASQTSAAGEAKPEIDMSIERVHAWGKMIALFSDSEQMQAWGNDLTYDATTRQTVLKGNQMVAIKDGNLIQAYEMLLSTPEKKGPNGEDLTQARAKGPGMIGMGPIDPVTRKHTRQAHWNDWLIFSKDKQGSHDCELLTFNGGARFLDLAADQDLEANELKVWLIGGKSLRPDSDATAPRPADAPPPPMGETAPRGEAINEQRRPHRLDAIQRVKASSREIIVRDADYLTVQFEDATTAPPALPPLPVRPLPAGQGANASLEPGPSLVRAKPGEPAVQLVQATVPPAPARTPRTAAGPTALPGATTLLKPTTPLRPMTSPQSSSTTPTVSKSVPPTKLRPIGERPTAAELQPPQLPPAPGPAGAKVELVPSNPPKFSGSLQTAGGAPLMGRRKPPLELSARTVKTWVQRHAGGKTELDRVECFGRVVVHQDPNPDQERGVDITGQYLELKRFPEGHDLLVTGSDRDDAILHYDKISIKGNRVQIDQRSNIAKVDGPGTLRLKTASDFEGNPLQEPKWVEIWWQDRMEFRGAEKWASFEGDVQADQKPAQLLCQNMQVMLDREVWFNQVEKEQLRGMSASSISGAANSSADPKRSPPAGASQAKDRDTPKIRHVVCDQTRNDPTKVIPGQREMPVSFVDELREKGQWIRYQSIDARTLTMDNERKEVQATGPGEVRLLQMGAEDPLHEGAKPSANNVPPRGGYPTNPRAPTPTPASSSASARVLKLTWIEFEGRMKATETPKKAVFLGKVDVMHMPANQPNMKIQLTKLPPKGMHLRCEDSMTVYAHKLADGRTSQELIAKGNASVRTEEFWGRADEIKYDESKELVTFQGSFDHPAVLYRSRGVGMPPEQFKGVKIMYNRRTGQFNGEGVTELRSPN